MISLSAQTIYFIANAQNALKPYCITASIPITKPFFDANNSDHTKLLLIMSKILHMKNIFLPS